MPSGHQNLHQRLSQLLSGTFILLFIMFICMKDVSVVGTSFSHVGLLSCSVGVDRPSHDALQAEVLQLEAALGDVRRDVQALSECRTGLDRVQQTVRTSVFYQDVVDAEKNL